MQESLPPATSEPRKPKRRQGVKTIVVILACCAAIFWAARFTWESMPVNVLTRALRNGNDEERRVAAQELGGVSASAARTAIPALIVALSDRSEEVRASASKALGSAVTTVAKARPTDPVLKTGVEALFGALGDTAAPVRSTTADSLAALVYLSAPPGPAGSTRALDAIARLLDDPSPEVRVSAAFSIGLISEVAREGLDASVLALLKTVSGSEPKVRSACEAALRKVEGSDAKLTSAIVPKLIEGLTSPDINIRPHSARLLGAIGPDAAPAVPALLEIVKAPADSSTKPGAPNPPDPRGPAALALASVTTGTPRAAEAVATLLTLLREPGPPRVRSSAAQALAKFKTTELEPARPVLLTVLKATSSDNGPPASSVCDALTRASLGTPHAAEAVAALTSTLDSPTTGTRLFATRALGEFGPAASSALPRLRTLSADDKNAQIRAAASESIEQIEPSADTTKAK